MTHQVILIKQCEPIMEQKNGIKIIASPDSQNPFIVACKPKGIPSAPLSADDKNNALYFVSELFPEVKSVSGKKTVEYGLVHRIDTATDGLLLIAATQEAYDFFIEQQKNNLFIKRYKAVCDFTGNIQKTKDGFPYCAEYQKLKKLKTGEIFCFTQQSLFRPFGIKGKEVRPVTQDSSDRILEKAGTRLYTTEIRLEKKENSYSAICEITNGYRHQVRCHLAWSGIAIKGDLIYNPFSKEGQEFSFTAFQLEFAHPLTKKILKFSI